MDPLVTTFSKKTSIRQVNSNRDSTFLWGPYFSYRATWGLFRRDFVDPRGLPVQIPLSKLAQTTWRAACPDPSGACLKTNLLEDTVSC